MATPARISAVCVCAAAVAGVWALWSHRRLKLLQAKLQNIFEAAEKVQKAQEAPAPVQVVSAPVAEERELSPGFFLHRQIGVLRTPFPTLQGAPRQGVLVPSTRGVIYLDAALPVEALDGLDAFSHVWLVYIFHKNTNYEKHARTQRLAEVTSQKTSTSFKRNPRFRFMAKVSPPALKGKRIGVIATRSPHHPNAIGIIAVRLEGIDCIKKVVHVSGIDCLDGTPILDIKPYLPYSDSFPSARIPDWVADPTPNPVTFTPAAVAELTALVESGAMSMYTDPTQALAAAKEVVSVNIKAKEYGCPRDLPFDGLKLTYITATDGSKEVTTVRRLGAGDSEGQTEEAGEEKAED